MQDAVILSDKQAVKGYCVDQCCWIEDRSGVILIERSTALAVIMKRNQQKHCRQCMSLVWRREYAKLAIGGTYLNKTD